MKWEEDMQKSPNVFNSTCKITFQNKYNIRKKKRIAKTWYPVRDMSTDQCQIAIEGSNHTLNNTLSRTSSITIIWELVRNAEFQALYGVY